jgi:CheY-like chemotaxis protein
MSDAKNKILIVDDDDNLSEMYSSYLTLRGYKITRVADGEKALATAVEHKPDLILLDVMMPNVSGFDVLDILRNTQKTADIPVIMLTALSSKQDIDRAKQLGANDYLEKSAVDLSVILERIQELIGGQKE